MSKYGWVIVAGNEIVYGPDDLSNDMKKKVVKGDSFKLYDGDSELCYTGKIVGKYQGFEPLDDYGYANGCTEIKIFNSKTKKREII